MGCSDIKTSNGCLVNGVGEIPARISSLTLGQHVSQEDIERFLSCKADQPVTLWSMQQPGAVECLESTGRLLGNPAFAFAPERTGKSQAGKKDAYAWMNQQMKKRLGECEHDLPIWALLSRPEYTTRGGDRLLRIEVPKSRILVSFYQPWHQLLGVMAHLECNGGRWPHLWASDSCPYVSAKANDKGKEFLGGGDGREAMPRPRRAKWPEDECRASWEGMFDLSEASRDGFLWQPISLQAMLFVIFRSDLKEILPIALREN